MEAETKEETNPLDGVQGDYMLITTFRKNGAGVPTPTWYGRENGKLYLFSLADAGKIKRVRNNPKVEVASCTFKGKPTGPTIPAQARIVPKEEEFVARRALRRHYPLGFRWSEFFANGLLRRKWTFLEMFPYPQTDRHEGPLPLRQP